MRKFRLRVRTPKGTPLGSRDLRSLWVTFHNVISGQKAPLGRILRNFRCAHPMESSSGSLLVALSVMRNDTFCTTTIVRDKRGNALPGMRRTYLRWRHFRSSMRSGQILRILHKCDLSCPHILLLIIEWFSLSVLPLVTPFVKHFLESCFSCFVLIWWKTVNFENCCLCAP